MESKIVNFDLKIADLLRIRLVVFQLGEIDSWWPTNISKQGVDFLSYSVPKTAQLASIQLAFEIAKKLHDTQINYGKYHLFRLRPTDEEKIFEYIKTHKSYFLNNDRNWLLNELNQISTDISIDTLKGAVQIGTINEIDDETVTKSFARHYYEAFKANYNTYPYLS